MLKIQSVQVGKTERERRKLTNCDLIETEGLIFTDIAICITLLLVGPVEVVVERVLIPPVLSG